MPLCSSSCTERNPQLTELAAIVRRAFADRDGATLARWASAEGVRFTPYAWVSPEGDVELQSEELRGAFDDPQVRTWGSFDGSGRPIELTFAAYVDRFVTPKRFVPGHDPQITQHAAETPGRLGSGNTMSNLPEIYPDAQWIEFYVPGIDPKYGGMDWARLALVFVFESGTQKLRAVVHDEWTI